MLYGFGGNVLRIELGSNQVDIQPLDPAFARHWLGGRGFIAKILYDEVPVTAGAFDPDNLLVISPGVLSGHFAPGGSKCCFGTISPITNGHGDSTVGGHFGPELKFAGYDLVIIKGIAARPSYLLIDDHKIEIRDAAPYWGKGSMDAEKMLKDDLGADFEIATIGPAGENLVTSACITHDYGRQAGRCGIGAVMGAKKIKAIAVRGTKSLPVYDLKRTKEVNLAIIKRTARHPNMAPWQQYGTAMFVGWANNNGVYPVRNFQTTYLENHERLDGPELVEKLLVSHKACFGCWMNCGKYSKVSLPDRATVYVEGPEYETNALCGGNCGFLRIEEVAYNNWLCDSLGIDSMSGGGLVAFAMECYEKGLITTEQLEGRELRWGNVDDFEHFLHLVVSRRGIGDWFAEGLAPAAKKIGGGAEKFAAQVKGMGMSGYDGRYAPAMLLGYMTSDIGAHHNRAWTITLDDDIGRDVVRGKAKLVVYLQHIRPFFDSISSCRLFWGEVDVTPEEYIQAIVLATGWSDFTLAEAMKASERVWNLNRAHFLTRHAQIDRSGRSFDYPNARFYEEAVPTGPGKGARLTLEQLDLMLDEYYAARGWGKNGNPTKEVLLDLGLADVASRLEEAGLLGALTEELPAIRGERYKPKAF
ncbi:MAG: aldehyde ferredoxin oxidoreductase family protein [Smithellaceae bacterium]|nr:aldehyde ferredoxin oxidoreductase family protein [Smithellaceae bacterium]